MEGAARIADLLAAARQALSEAASTDAVRSIEHEFLGKNGALSGLMKLLGQVGADERPAFGAALNQAKSELQTELDLKAASLLANERSLQFEKERIDMSLPGEPTSKGRTHILAETFKKIKSVMGSLGFVYYESPELELFKYNFDALNYPPDHPAMDEQDTFYVTDDLVLRTQCTALQGRVFETVKPPFRAFTVGRTYRNEAVDRTHSHTFHQIDVFMVDEGVSMANLKWTLGTFARAMFGGDVKVRFRPDFFPFVEPGVDYAISTPKLFDGRWIELGGAGLIHPNILRTYGIDTERFSGFAFGLGADRIPMMAYGIDDLRHLLDNDQRFLEQFQ